MRPNILYIHSHDTGRYIQPFGYNIPTPNLQKLAQEGTLFRQAFCAAPTCSPSRAALLTGRAPHSCGMIGLAHRGVGQLNDYSQHLIHTLHKAGYTSALAGEQHVAQDKSVIGYHKVLDTPTARVKDVAPAAVSFLDNVPDKPFFLSVGFSETHREFHEPEPENHPAEDARYCRPPQPLPDTPATRRDMASYIASARIMDQGIGMVLDALNANGLAENTLVISTTDHGIAFPAMKCYLTDHGIGVSLIMRGPGGFTGGKVCDAMISQIDVFPTLCDLLEIELPPWLQGRSFMPVVRGRVKEINDAVFAEVTYHAAYEPKRAVRTRRWKYIRCFDEHGKHVLSNIDDGLAKDEWLSHGLADRTPAPEQLYDLVFDPNETDNLVGRADVVGILTEMRRRLESWMQTTDDPLLSGPVPAPAGSRVNRIDGLSPNEPALVVG